VRCAEFASAKSALNQWHGDAFHRVHQHLGQANKFTSTAELKTTLTRYLKTYKHPVSQHASNHQTTSLASQNIKCRKA
jgi:cytosine/adenosine deaminase-related metal-dependent hydrolase